MRLQVDAKLRYFLPRRADVLLAIEAAPTEEQHLLDDKLTVTGVERLRTVPGDDSIGRRTWTSGEGNFAADYRGIFEIDRRHDPITGLPAPRLSELPASVIPYLWPSRFCEADRFVAFVEREFGQLTGGTQIEAMARWLRENVDYTIGSSHSTTSAVDTFVARQGVCRDYAHVMAAFARAAGIPARLVSAYAWELRPQDFHAVVDVWLDGRWHLIDASGLAPREGLIRIAVGRDATDISFMTIFGHANFMDQQVTVTRLD